MNWEDDVDFFQSSEFQCSHCGIENMDMGFVRMLDELRYDFGAPILITSGFRCPQHPIEARKSTPGPHSTGMAADLHVSRHRFRYLIALVVPRFEGLGFRLHGEGRFIHVDMCGDNRAWTYG